MNLRQPLLGVVATALIIVIALSFISLFSFVTFTGWVAYFMNCVIAMQIVIGITWGAKHPRFAAARLQPVKGVLLTLLALAVGFVVAGFHHAAIGGRISPPTPMLAMWAIGSVVVTFWAAIIWGGWPFGAVLSRTVVAGLTMLVACYAAEYLLFRTFFDYGFMSGAPVYVADQDPHGFFNAWNALVFYITGLAALFLLVHFDLWPFSRWPAVMRQPRLGVVWTLTTIVIAGLTFYIALVVLRDDAVHFFTRVPLPFIFGTIVVLNMLEGSLFARIAQPAKGVLSATAAFVVGSLLAWGYLAMAPTVTGELPSGPPAYSLEIWLASSLLSVTFPFLIFYAVFFEFWLLRAQAHIEQYART